MEKVWYVEIDGQREGPFSLTEMRNDHRITPDTRAWKLGFSHWKPIREIPELKELFRDAKTPEEGEEPEEELEPEFRQKPKKAPFPQDELALDIGNEPPYLFWMLIAAAIIAYFLSQLYWMR